MGNGDLGLGGSGARIRAIVCEECGALLPPYAEGVRKLHYERDKKIDILLKLFEVEISNLSEVHDDTKSNSN